MRTLLPIALVLAVAGGCKKLDRPAPAPTGAPTTSGTEMLPGSGGAVQGVRKAVVRTVNINEMDNIRVFIHDASLASGKMPSVQEINTALQTGAPAIFKHVQEGAIVLTGTQQREGVWAYTREAQTPAGEHLVCTASSIERMAGPALQQRLQQQR